MCIIFCAKKTVALTNRVAVHMNLFFIVTNAVGITEGEFVANTKLYNKNGAWNDNSNQSVHGYE